MASATATGRRGTWLTALACIAGFVVAAPAQAGTFAVDSTDDAADRQVGDGVCATLAGACTLRAAVQESNASGAADAIAVPPGAYHLGAGPLSLLGELAITEDVTISGAGARSTVIDRGSGALDGRVIGVHGSGTQATIANLTLAGGSTPGDGGTIVNSAILTLSGVTVRGGLATRGGGIATSGDLTITDSTISGNDARASGGGIAVFGSGTLTATNTTVSGNEVLNPGIGSGGTGGGISNTAGNATLTNVTVAANKTAEQGGGGISGPFTLINSVLANGTTTGNCRETSSGTASSGGHNLSDDTSCAFTASGDRTGISALLSDLRQTEGSTDAHVPLSGSPLIDTADPLTCPRTDQRGLPRPQGAGCDIGAAEYEPVADLTLNMTDSPDPIPADDQLTYTISVSNLGPDPGFGVVLRHELPPGTVLLSVGQNCTASSDIVTCSLDRLVQGATATAAVVVRPETVGAITSTASVISDSRDPILASNVTSTATTVLSRLFAKPPGKVSPPPSPPVQGKSVGAALVRGLLKVRRPGQRSFTRLDHAETLPVGSTIDASRGTVRLTSATDTTGGTQTADFYGGSFKLDQRPGQALTRLRLTGGSFRSCSRTAAPRASGARAAPGLVARAAAYVRDSGRQGRAGAAKKKAAKKPERHVWGNGKGKFRTEGRYGSASVRGTQWYTQDLCEGTRVHVRRGVVAVRDFARKRTTLVRAGRTVIVRRPARR